MKLCFWKFILTLFFKDFDSDSLSDINHSFMADEEKAGKVGT